MSPEQVAEGVNKGLEAWALQTSLDLGLVLGFLALGLMASRAYLNAYRQRMTLRLSVELWEIIIDLAIDAMLFITVLLGLLTTNPDVMVDIKIALPWLPLANLLFGVALILRAFYGGHKNLSKAWWLALSLVAIACVLNWFGFTFVMEGATDEYFPSNYPAFWQSLHNMRSDMNRGLSLQTFYWLSPAYALLFVWAIVAALRNTIAAAKK